MEETWNFAMDIGYTLQYIFFPNWASLIFTFMIIVCYVFFRVAFQQFNTRMDEFFEETIAIELKKEVPGCMKVNFLPAIKRNLKDSPYLRSAGKLQTVWITITDGVLTLLRSGSGSGSGSEWPKDQAYFMMHSRYTRNLYNPKMKIIFEIVLADFEIILFIHFYPHK